MPYDLTVSLKMAAQSETWSIVVKSRVIPFLFRVNAAVRCSITTGQKLTTSSDPADKARLLLRTMCVCVCVCVCGAGVYQNEEKH